jgi:hypothetical protein
MNLTVEWDGSNRPFEGETTVLLEVIPASAKVNSALVEVTAVDPGDSFVETIPFATAGQRWGANKVRGTFVEVDFRARRTLAALRGTNLTGANLQIDPGGAYVEINDHGAFLAPGDTRFAIPLASDNTRIVMPSFTIARFKLTPAGVNPVPDLTSVEVRSVPENVSLRLGGNPAFHTFLGPMTGTETSIDFALLLEEFLGTADQVNGFYVVPLVVHSDSIARLRLRVTLDVLTQHVPLPAGVTESVLSYSFSSLPAGAAATLPLSLSPNARALAGQTSVHFLGAFDDTRVALGPVGPVPLTMEAPISSAQGQAQAQAQPFTVPADVSITGIDLLLRATKIAAQVQVNLQDDLGGKPGLTTLLPAPIPVELAAKPEAKPEWVSIALPAEFKLTAGTRYWLVVQRSVSDAAWTVQPGPNPLQQTNDGALSWRASEVGPVEGVFRLRYRPGRFTMPIHVFVGEGAAAREVPLARYEPLGRVDFTLDAPEFADTINQVLDATAAQACSPVEHLDNREFQDWLLVGDAPSARSLGASHVSRATAFTPDGRILYVLGQSEGTRLHAIDPVCGDEVMALQLEERVEPPTFGAAMAASGDGLRLIAHLNGRTWVIDLQTQELLGFTDDAALATNAMAAAGRTLYFLSGVSNTAGFRIQQLSLDSLEQHLLTGSALAVQTLAPLPIGVTPRGLAVSAAGDRVYVPVDEIATAAAVHSLHIFDTGAPGRSQVRPLTFAPSGIAIHPEQPFAYIGQVGATTIQVVDISTGAGRGTLATVTTGDQFSISRLAMPAISPAYLAASINRPDIASIIDLIQFGEPVPEVWQIMAGHVSPVCLDEPFRIGAFLGRRTQGSSPDTSISQVVPASSGCPYEFSFWGIADADGAVGEIVWRVTGCSSPRRDTVPIDSAPATAISRRPFSADSLKLHRLRVNAPPGAVGAEVRFRTTLDVRAVVDRASLRTVSPILSNGDFLEVEAGLPKGWTLVPESPLAFSIKATQSGVEFVNGGLQTVAVFQQVDVKPGSAIDVEFSGAINAAGSSPFLNFAWVDSDAPPSVILLPPNAPRLRVASVAVPQGATKAEFSIQIPPGATINMEALSVAPDSRVSIPITVFAEAPGQLSVLNMAVVTDTRPPAPPTAPPGGLCPPTNPEDDECKDDGCYCPSCEGTDAVVRPVAVLTPSRRPAVQVVCANCGTVTVRPVAVVRTPVARTPVGAVAVASVRPLPILRQSIRQVAIQRAPARLAAVRPAAPVAAVSLKAVLGLRVEERDKLEASEFNTLHKLAEATPERVATLIEGATVEHAESIIKRARSLLLDREEVVRGTNPEPHN